AGDERLLPVQHPPVAVPAGGRGDAVGVGAGVGLGDRERHLHRPVREPRQPVPLLLLRPVPRDDRGADRRGDDHEQQRAARRGQFLAHGGEVADAAATAAVLLGHVHAEVAEPPGLVPQLVGLAPGLGALHVVGRAVLGAQLGDGLAQRLPLLRLDEAHAGFPSMTARTAPDSTCCPAVTFSVATVPEDGAAMRCSIFIASRTTRVCPSATSAPTSVSTRSTVPGMGARSDPGAIWLLGSVNRGTARNSTGPRRESTYTASPAVTTVNVSRRP